MVSVSQFRLQRILLRSVTCVTWLTGPAASLLHRHAVASFVMGQKRDADANVTTGSATLRGGFLNSGTASVEASGIIFFPRPSRSRLCNDRSHMLHCPKSCLSYKANRLPIGHADRRPFIYFMTAPGSEMHQSAAAATFNGADTICRVMGDLRRLGERAWFSGQEDTIGCLASGAVP